ncbi:CBS domain-containing protein [Nonomuraea zeae]
MTTKAISVRAGTPFKDIAETLITHGISAVPVVDDADHVLGVVSRPTCCARRSSGSATTRRVTGRRCGPGSVTGCRRRARSRGARPPATPPPI